MMRKLQGAGMGNFKMYKREDMQKMAKDMEQLMGRTHRPGQKADEVNVQIMLGCWETWNAWNHANGQSAAARDTYGEDYKLLAATKVFPEENEIRKWSGDRWTKQAVKPTDGTAASIWSDDDVSNEE